MHKRKRRKRILRAAALALFALLCALAAAAVFWLYTNRAPDIAVQPQGAVCALRLSPEAEGLAQMEEKQLDAFLDGFVSFARASGMNAVAVDADPVDGCVMFRTKAYGVFPAAAQSDTLTHRYDPLAALCEKAADSGLGVYAHMHRSSLGRDGAARFGKALCADGHPRRRGICHGRPLSARNAVRCVARRGIHGMHGAVC